MVTIKVGYSLNINSYNNLYFNVMEFERFLNHNTLLRMSVFSHDLKKHESFVIDFVESQISVGI